MIGWWCIIHKQAGLPMNKLIAAVNLNSQDVEEGQLPQDGPQQPPALAPSHHFPPLTQHIFKAPQRHLHPSSPHPHEDSSGEIVLEVVQDKFYNDRRTKRIGKGEVRSRNHAGREKERTHSERFQKQKKTQRTDRNEKKTNVAPPQDREDMSTAPTEKGTAYQPPQPPYYAPYSYSPHGMHMQMGQYPPYQPSYPYQMPYMQQQSSSFNGLMVPPYPPPHSHQHTAPYKQQYLPPQYPQYMMERQDNYNIQQPYRPPHPPSYPSYGSYSTYAPYDYYDRHKEAQQRQEKQRASRRREFFQDLRGELKRNVKEFNGEAAGEILEAAKCILKFQEAKPSQYSTSSRSTSNDLPDNETIKQSITQGCYERSLQRIEGWLEGEDANVREFTKGFLSAIQMGDVIAKARELRLKKKVQPDAQQSDSKRYLDTLVRDPKKMIF